MKYLGQGGEPERSPTERKTAPLIPELSTPVLSDDDLRAQLATCAGRDFVDLRDTALLLLFIAIGGRRAEVLAGASALRPAITGPIHDGGERAGQPYGAGSWTS